MAGSSGILSPGGTKPLRLSRKASICAALIIVAVVGFVDYETGYEVSLAVFYLLAISLGLWFVGTQFAILVAAASVGSSLLTDWAAGARYHTILIPAWNAAITMMFYLIVIWLLSKVKAFQKTLESHVRQRTAALTTEMAEKERLEQEILDISEREHQRFGHDLHDGLCQQLLGAAIAGKVLAQRLQPVSHAESTNASEVVQMVEDAILMARNMARGLSPLYKGPEGLAEALAELATSTRELFNVNCDFRCSAPPPKIDQQTATHLYRIAQESISNAIRHGKARRIEIRFTMIDDGALLCICDDGSGLPSGAEDGDGMGLRIMRHRANIIGADFRVKNQLHGGVIVTCTLPRRPATHSLQEI